MSNVCFGLSVSLTAHFGAFFPSEAWWEVPSETLQALNSGRGGAHDESTWGHKLKSSEPSNGDVHYEGAWGNKLSFLLFCLLPSFLTPYQMYSASGIIMVLTCCSVSSVCYNSTDPEMTFLGSWPEIQGADKKCFANEAALVLVRATHEDYL